MAKFKIGDEVRVGNPHLADRGRYGKVVSAGVDGNPLLYDVDLGGGVQLFSERDLVAANSLSRNAVVQKALNAATARNASTDGEFAKLKAMGKASALKYIQDNSQALIDKYGYKEFADMAKRIQALRLKPIKKGRFAGKYGQMTYYVDYTADSWAAKTYGKDGTNITEIQVTGPYVVDPDGKERRHIWYEWSQGREVIKPENGDVAELVKRLLAGSDAIKAGDPEYAWNSSAEGNHIVANAMAAQARNAVGRDKQDAASVELWAGMFENNFLKFVLPKSTDKAKTRKSGESIIKHVEEALGSEGGREQLKRMGWTIQKMRDELEKGLNAATARNAEDDWVERFEVGGVYHGPYMNKDWLAKVLSRTDSSIRVAIKSRRDKTWHGKDEQVTLRINKRQAEEDGTEVAKGYGWEFWASDFE